MRFLFSSLHNYCDRTSGAAISTFEVLSELSKRGHSVHTLCGPLFDSGRNEKGALAEFLTRQKIPFRFADFQYKHAGISLDYQLVLFEINGIVSTAFFPRLQSTSQRLQNSKPLSLLYLKLLEEELRTFKPDFYSSYGGYVAAVPAVELTKSHGVKTLFWLHNQSYPVKEPMRRFDVTIVPSTYTQSYYLNKLGLPTEVIPPVINREASLSKNASREFVVFVNPAIEKGASFFLGLVRDLNKTRPEMKFLIVESREKISILKKFSALQGLKNLYFLPQVDEPRIFLDRAIMVVMPSYCDETLGRLILEAGWNGTPILTSDRGALPETLGEAQRLFHLALPIPARFKAHSNFMPTINETAVWRQSIEAIYDDSELRDQIVRSLQENSKRFDSKIVVEQLESLLGRL